MFHFRSHGSRDLGDGAKPWLEGAHAMLRWLPRGHEVHAAMHLSQATRPRHVGLYARTELPALQAGISAHVSGSREVTVVFEPPTNMEVLMAAMTYYVVLASKRSEEGSVGTKHLAIDRPINVVRYGLSPTDLLDQPA